MEFLKKGVYRTVPCASGGYPITRRGSVGSYVLILQDSLNRLGYGTGGLDGIFGPATENAVINYQRSRGLSADGIVGCATWGTLMNSVIPKTETLEPVD